MPLLGALLFGPYILGTFLAGWNKSRALRGFWRVVAMLPLTAFLIMACRINASTEDMWVCSAIWVGAAVVHLLLSFFIRYARKSFSRPVD